MTFQELFDADAIFGADIKAFGTRMVYYGALPEGKLPPGKLPIANLAECKEAALAELGRLFDERQRLEDAQNEFNTHLESDKIRLVYLGDGCCVFQAIEPDGDIYAKIVLRLGWSGVTSEVRSDSELSETEQSALVQLALKAIKK